MTAAGIVFFPLLGAIIAGLFGRFIGDRPSQLVTCAGMVLSAACAWIVLFSVAGTEGYKVDVLTWIQSGTFEVDWTIRVDPLSAIMMFVVSTVSTLIHIYSIGYMSHDPHRAAVHGLSLAVSPSSCWRWSPPTTSCSFSSAGRASGWSPIC